MRRSQTLIFQAIILQSLTLLTLAAFSPAQAQDVRGLELCTAEKQMDRRTGCLQANVDFLKSQIDKNARESRQKLDAAARDLGAARQEIAALKAALATIEARLERLEKPARPKDGKDAK